MRGREGLQETGGLQAVLAALADPARRSILARLRQGEASVTQLAHPLRMTLTGTRKHLAVLAHAGLVATRKQGRTRWVRLRPEALEPIADFLVPYRDLRLAGVPAAPYIDLSDMDVT